MYDARCLELADTFLRDEPKLADRSAELAQVIQDAIEEWMKSALDGANKGNR